MNANRTWRLNSISVVMITTVIVVGTYELLRRLLPALSTPQSHALTLLFLMAAAALPSLWLLRRIRQLRDERSEGNDTLLRERAILRTLIDNIPDYLYVKDTQSKCVLVNRAMAELMKYTPEQIVGKSDFDFYPREFAQVFYDEEQKVMSAGAALIDRRDEAFNEKGEKAHHLSTKVPLRDAAGTVVGIVGISRDITAQVNNEEALRNARAAAEAATRLKSEFLANMSHEIRTPMNGIIGMTELLLETTLDPVQQDYSQTIQDSGRALLTVINDILDFSKIEAGKLELEMIDMDPRAVVEEAARVLALQAHKKGLDLNVSIDPALPGMVLGDQGRLRQILLNLGSNAIKFTPAGEVTLAIKVLSHNKKKGTRLRFEVHDTGIGIPKDRLDGLFQPFTQVDASTTRQYGGTGLGLSIVRRLAELMQGQCGVDSEFGQGSHFWVTLHFAPATGAQPMLQLTPRALRGRRVLAVDDNATNRKILQGQMQQCGTDAEFASSAAEALQLMRAAHDRGNPFEVALLDHDMPVCNGTELGRQINADPQLNSARLVLLTSSGQRGDAARFAELGFAGYLLKPISQRDLTDCLSTVLGAKAEEWHVRSQPIITADKLIALRSQPNKARILLAEDNEVNQKVAGRILEKMGYQAVVVNNGREAVEAWGTGQYDLILMDCQMPDMDGYEATREIRRREGGSKHIPIVALTAHAMKGDDIACREAGMDDYVTKPIDRERLRISLESLLDTSITALSATSAVK